MGKLNDDAEKLLKQMPELVKEITERAKKDMAKHDKDIEKIKEQAALDKEKILKNFFGK